MAFRVEIAPRAFEDLDSIVAYIKDTSGVSFAERWFNGIMNDMTSLQEMPARCPLAFDPVQFGQEIRVLVHGLGKQTCKIYYAIDSRTPSSGVVLVFHVRPWARKHLGDQEIRDLIDGGRNPQEPH